MIAAVALSNEALVERLDDAPESLAQTHAEFTRLLMAHGILVHADASDRESFIAAIKELGKRAPDAGKHWEAVVTDGRWCTAREPAPEPVDTMEKLTAFRMQWGRLLDIAFMEQTRAELFGCPSDEMAWREPETGVEIARLGANWHTQTFDQLRRLADRHTIGPGTDRDTLAKERFQPLFIRSKRFTIVDQWLGRGVAQHHFGDRGASAWLNEGPHELEWLLRLVDQHADGATVSVLTTYDDGRDAGSVTREDVVAAFADVWKRTPLTGGLDRLQLFVGPRQAGFGKARQRFPHDRHIRFDVGVGFGLSAGFDRLRFARLDNAETWRLTYLWKPEDIRGLIEDENCARRLAGEVQAWE